jgi:hypothetical protein
MMMTAIRRRINDAIWEFFKAMVLRKSLGLRHFRLVPIELDYRLVKLEGAAHPSGNLELPVDLWHTLYLYHVRNVGHAASKVKALPDASDG